MDHITAQRRRIYLMRHGAVAYYDESGASVGPDVGVRLTADGREQAAAAGRALRGARVDRVITSGLPRTLETVELVVRELDHPPAGDPECWPELEELRRGPADGVPDAELEDAFLQAFRGVAARDATFTGGETIGGLLDRVVPVLRRVFADPDWSELLMVLHGGVNRAILSTVLAGEPRFFGLIEQSPACINVVDLDADRPAVVRAINITPYDLTHDMVRMTTIEEMLVAYLPSRPAC